MRRPLACFFVCTGMEVFRRNAQPASNGCSSERVWEVPNKHFCTRPKGHGAKIADWYQSALLAHSTLTLFALNCQRVLCGESQAVAWASHSHSDVPSRKPYYWCAKKADIPLFQLMPHLQCCKLMNCCFIKTEKPLHRKCSGFWKNAEKAGILICIHALCRLNG